MKYQLKLTEQAQNDLEDLIEYVYQQWGANQLEIYMEQLDRTIESLRERPQRQGRALGGPDPG